MATENWTVTGPQTIDVGPVDRLDANLLNGRIDVVVHDEPGVRVEVHSIEGRPLEVRLDGDRLTVGYSPTGGWQGFLDSFRNYRGKDRADVYVGVPAHVRVKLATVRGDGLVAGTQAKVSVATVGGSVMTTQTTGAVRVDTVSGEVTVRDHVGTLVMDSVSGDLTASGALTDVKLNTVSGNVTLDSSATPDVMNVNAVSADVLVRVPEPDGLDYTLRCVSGRLVVDGVEHRGTPGGAYRQAGPSGTPGKKLQVNSVSGNVTVLRGEPADAAAWDGPAGQATGTGAHPWSYDDAPTDAYPGDGAPWGTADSRATWTGGGPADGPADR
ncbi:DUF4097 family beta strand repeat-containing protein [Oerskovia gallyi]|uniref:DUF4097 family beta strand repeat protein n=1 Tax=Oerskovia gallyi TaxID=2762226 RepID=A0ABR8V2Y2_9CELL|nr:DUF4097 family beta strand repeat-containing protein [Oerskovia gallyi]MBD7999149.1 DUF4097 family beta strand repeat protein [Oerskovia gallyi]